MTTQEVKEYYGDTPEQFCRTLCKSCTSNDWYCPTLCNELEWVMRNFEKAVGRMAELDGDEVKFSQGLKRWKGRGDGMSVIIKGMEMPKNCKECDLYIEGACYAKGYRDYRSIMDTAKPDDCPLVEIPTPHGRLIDADAIQNYTVETFGQRLLIIDTAPTVIEAEGET